MTPLVTPRLRIVVRSPDEVRAQIAALPPEHRAQVSPAWLARIEAAAEPDPFLHGFAATTPGGVFVGQAGFKAPPADGVVELAYAVEDALQGQGHATEMAAALTAWALSQPQVRVVRAHTLPDGAASQRVLEKCGFRRVGEVVDEEDGLVVRFEKGG